jgi:hypothetical protein
VVKGNRTSLTAAAIAIPATTGLTMDMRVLAIGRKAMIARPVIVPDQPVRVLAILSIALLLRDPPIGSSPERQQPYWRVPEGRTRGWRAMSGRPVLRRLARSPTYRTPEPACLVGHQATKHDQLAPGQQEMDPATDKDERNGDSGGADCSHSPKPRWASAQSV